MTAIRTSSTRERFSRRAFMRGVGASAALLPLLDADNRRGAGPCFPSASLRSAGATGVAQPYFCPTGADPDDGN